MLTAILLTSVALLLAATAGQHSAARRRSLRAVGTPLAGMAEDAPVVVAAHDPVTGRDRSIPVFRCDTVIGTLTRLARRGRIAITAVEAFERQLPRHVQVLRGTLAVLDAQIVDEKSGREQPLNLDVEPGDDLIRLADHYRLHRLAKAHDLLDSLFTDGSRTLPMPVVNLEALDRCA